MTWIELAALISTAYRQFPAPPPLELCVLLDRPVFPGTIVEEEKSTRAAVDAIVRIFSRDRVWQEMTPNERHFVALRVHFVQPFVTLLALSKKGEKEGIFPNSSPEVGDETQIEWLLNDAWAAQGVFEWKGRVAEALAKELSEE